jgi:hypothetical protein
MFVVSTIGDSPVTVTFFERADLQVGVDRRGEVRRQLDAFANHRRESGSSNFTV